MRALAQRMESEDLEWVVAAIDINRDTGGNLSEILNTVSATIRERQRMAATGAHPHGRGSAVGANSDGAATPHGLLAVAHQPGQASPCSCTAVGLVALFFGGILMVVGTIWIRRIVNSIAL